MIQRELRQLLTKMSTEVRITPNSVTDDVKADAERVMHAINEIEPEDCQSVLATVDEIIRDMARKWQFENASNYMIFVFRKIRSHTRRRCDTNQRLNEPTHLAPASLLELIAQSSRGLNREYPDSIRAFLECARKSPISTFALPPGFDWPPSVPVSLVLNSASLKSMGSEPFSLLTGHCLVGYEPGEDIHVSVRNAVQFGPTADDALVYRHVNSVSQLFKARGWAHDVLVNLDTLYYRDKLVARSGGTLDQSQAAELVKEVASSHQEVMHCLLEQAVTLRSSDSDRFEQLQEVLHGGLLEFVQAMYPDRTTALNTSVALVAASYLYSPMIEGRYTLAIESALNVQVPAGVVLPYLSHHGREDKFCFIGLLPLPDLKMSHGAMYFGNANNGKLYVKQSRADTEARIRAMSINLEKPHECFYTRYFLASRNALPEEHCHRTQCQNHVRLVLEDFRQMETRVAADKRREPDPDASPSSDDRSATAQ